MQKIHQIKYKSKKIKVYWCKLDDCFAVYDPNHLTLHIRNDLNKKILAKTIFHELWHIIVVTNKKEIIKIGEEKTAILAEEFYTLFKQNPRLRKFLNDLY